MIKKLHFAALYVGIFSEKFAGGAAGTGHIGGVAKQRCAGHAAGLMGTKMAKRRPMSQAAVNRRTDGCKTEASRKACLKLFQTAADRLNSITMRSKAQAAGPGSASVRRYCLREF